jgi:hypothetical protein
VDPLAGVMAMISGARLSGVGVKVGKGVRVGMGVLAATALALLWASPSQAARPIITAHSNSKRIPNRGLLHLFMPSPACSALSIPVELPYAEIPNLTKVTQPRKTFGTADFADFTDFTAVVLCNLSSSVVQSSFLQ